MRKSLRQAKLCVRVARRQRSGRAQLLAQPTWWKRVKTLRRRRGLEAAAAPSESKMSTLAENLITAVKSVAALAARRLRALIGRALRLPAQTHLRGPRHDIGPALPIRKGRKIEVDVSNEQRPRGAPDVIVGRLLSPHQTKCEDARVLARQRRPARKCGGFPGAGVAAASRSWFLGIVPGALCTPGEPTETTIHWTSQRMLQHLRETLKTPARDTVAFGQSIGGAVALRAARLRIGRELRPAEQLRVDPSHGEGSLPLHPGAAGPREGPVR